MAKFRYWRMIVQNLHHKEIKCNLNLGSSSESFVFLSCMQKCKDWTIQTTGWPACSKAYLCTNGDQMLQVLVKLSHQEGAENYLPQHHAPLNSMLLVGRYTLWHVCRHGYNLLANHFLWGCWWCRVCLCRLKPVDFVSQRSLEITFSRNAFSFPHACIYFMCDILPHHDRSSIVISWVKWFTNSLKIVK